MKMNIKKTLSAILLLAFSLVIFLFLSRTKAFESIEQWTFDLRQIAFSPKTEASQDIVMVWLDEQTMKALPFRSPVPRDFLAELNNKLAAASPKLIAYDIFLKDPSFPKDDEALSKSLKSSNAYAVMPMRIGGCKKTGKDGCVDPPLPLFLDSLKGIGLADLPFNPFDSIVRNARFSFDTDQGPTPSFASLIFEKAAGKKTENIINNKNLWPHIGPFFLTPFVKKNKETFIRFAGPPGKIGSKDNEFKIFPAHLVAKGFVPQSWLQDKIILVGAAYEDLQDSYLTPYYAKITNYARMNGVEIHANILSSLLTGQFYYTFEPWQYWTLIVTALFFSLIFSAFCPPSKSGITLCASIIVYVFMVILAFRSRGFVLPALAPVSAGIISYGVGIAWHALTEGKQRRWIKGVFAQYVPATVVDQLIRNPKLVSLGGEERTVTSLFSDIASFTSISEKMDPVTLVKFLNEYLTRMNDILFRYGGTIDKYEGDAIVAFFNAPLDVKNHETAAALTALEIQIATEDLSKKWESRFGRPLVTRVGINSGKAVVGNIGSQSRFDYTAIGDTINLASRLEGANKFYGTRVIASESTARGCDVSVISRPVDRVRVKGKAEPILIYEIMGIKSGGHPSSLIKLSQLFTEAFGKFETRDLDGSMQILEEILKSRPDDGPSGQLLKRIAMARENTSWDLVTNLESK
jgi:adenylate cyclase